jgi:predicted RNase H-like nuclease (RuvC/YqgF family)
MFKDGEELLEELTRKIEELESANEMLTAELDAAEAEIEDLEDDLYMGRKNLVESDVELKLALEIIVRAKIIEDKPCITENDLRWLLLKYM